MLFLNNQKLFINRELSWLQFNERVFEEVQDMTLPIFERLKYQAIVSSNLDEFFMVRVASLKDQVNAGINKVDPSGMNPEKQLSKIAEKVHEMVGEHYAYYQKALDEDLKKHKYHMITKEDLDAEDMESLEHFFDESIYPVLTPMAVDSSRPFPLISNKSLNIGVLIEEPTDDDGMYFATVQVPSILPRMIRLKTHKEFKYTYILLEDVIELFIHRLFYGKTVILSHPYRITRSGDFNLREEDADDLLREIEKSLKLRKWGEVTRLEIQAGSDHRLIDLLIKELHITKQDVYEIDGPLDLTFLFKVPQLVKMKSEKLLDKPHHPQIPKDLYQVEDIFKAIQEKDMLLHHPFDSFEPVIDFIRKASEDPDVLAIKQTLYRVSGDSPIIRALAEAAERGKQVTVLVELKARFDEENNINWAKRLEKTGCHVIYGIVGLKTHSKITLVVRKEKDRIRRYIHIGTGNYNDVTAKLYTDLGMLTCNEYIGADASAFFNMLSGYSEPIDMYKLILAPINLRESFMAFIEREINQAEKGQEAHIIMKINALVDPEMIDALYRASVAGVKVDLIIRGINCLRSGIEGVSENIHVRSIVGKFLEHTRIFYFYNGGKEEVYLSSADLMQRNLDRRIEILFPVESADMKKRINTILDIYLRDNVKARVQNPNGDYDRLETNGERINSQEYLCDLSKLENKDHIEGISSLLQ